MQNLQFGADGRRTPSDANMPSISDDAMMALKLAYSQILDKYNRLRDSHHNMVKKMKQQLPPEQFERLVRGGDRLRVSPRGSSGHTDHEGGSRSTVVSGGDVIMSYNVYFMI